MNININNGITVNFRIKPKISKTDQDLYHIYIELNIYQRGILNGKVSVSTGTKVNRKDYKGGRLQGRSTKSNLLNERFDTYLTSTKDLLYELSLKKVKTCSQLVKELEQNLRQTITGKPRRGSKNDFISKLKTYSYEFIMNRLFEDKPMSKERKRGYQTTIDLLSDFFQNDIPTIDQISTEDLERFKKWMSSKYPNQNTCTTRKSYVAAVFKHGVKLKILNTNPLPENFRGSFVDGNRKVLSENECLKIMSLNDNELNHTELVSKYCLLVQLLTGMGYSDMKDLKHTNIKYDENQTQYYIEKERNKTGIPFKVFLTENGLYMVRKLTELTGDENRPFNIPSLTYSLKIYKTLGQKVKIETNITTYTLRHTFSVNFMENDGRIEDLSKFLGHRNLKTTQIYGKISNKRLSEKMKRLEKTSKIHQLQKPQKILHAV